MSGILSVTIGQMRRQRGPNLQLAGIIVDGSVRYNIYVAPVVGGQNGGVTGTIISWKTSNSSGPAATQTLTNGKAATDAMISAGTSTYPAAGFAQTARTALLSGYNDWYIPARDELELCYRNLKSFIGNNSTGVRQSTGYGGGLSQGSNDSSDPVGAAYTTTVPAQTTVISFQSGNAESWIGNHYWSSTENSSTESWRQYFGDGNQTVINKTTGCYLRLIRRVAA